MSPPKSIAIIGAGISGLAAAHRISELAPDATIRLFEESGRPGGVLQTVHTDGLLIEQSADAFITNVPYGLDLCRRLGMEADLLATDESRRRAFVVHRGRLVPVPEGFLLMAPSRLGPIVTTPLLSLKGKLRLLAERFVPPRRSREDESLASFVRRRFGNEVFERLVQPLVGGIYTADPERLSIRATMPQFPTMEQEHGSVIRATLKQRASHASASGARYGMFVAPRLGMTSLIERLVERLPQGTISQFTSVDRVERSPTGGWRLKLRAQTSGEPLLQQSYDADAVIVAAPAHRARTLLEPLDQQLADLLGRIPYAGVAVVNLLYRRRDIAHPLNGFGLVVPAIEHRQILAASFASNKFPHRAPEDSVLVRVFIGGACQPELTELSDQRLRAIAVGELAELLGAEREPTEAMVVRWPRTMPQYHVGHLELVEAIEARVDQHAGLALAGNAYRGVGVPHCIHSGEQAAERILQASAT